MLESVVWNFDGGLRLVSCLSTISYVIFPLNLLEVNSHSYTPHFLSPHPLVLRIMSV